MRPALLAPLAVLLVAAPLRAQTPAAPPPSGGPIAPTRTPAAPGVGTEATTVTFTGHLSFELGPGTQQCPGASTLRALIARRLGYDPFDPATQGTPLGSVRVVIARTPNGLAATAAYDGAYHWTRKSTVNGTSRSVCELALAGLASAIAADLTVLATNPPQPAPPAPEPTHAVPPAPPAPAPVAPPPAPPPGPPSTPLRVRFEAGVGIFGVGGLAPGFAFGGTLHIGVAIFPVASEPVWFSFALEGRADAPASGVAGAQRVRTSLLALAPMVCLHGPLGAWSKVAVSGFGCVLGTMGGVSASFGSEAKSFAFSGAYAGIGGRSGVEALFASRYMVRLYGEGLATVHHLFGVTGVRRDAAAASRFSGGGGLAFALVF